VQNKIVLVTCCHSRVGYNVACGLIRAGFKVVASGRAGPSMCARVPGVIGDHVYPDPFGEPDAFLEVLASAAHRHGASAILPVHEELFVVSRHREYFDRVAPVLVPDFDTLLRVHDKWLVPAYAEAAGVPTPRTVLIERAADVPDAIEAVGLPLLFKPRFGSGAQGIRTFRTAAELHALHRLTDDDLRKEPAILQEWLPGIGAGVNMLVKEGRVLAISGHHRLREVPIAGGTGSAHLSMRHEGMLAAGKRALHATPFRDGVIMFEFRYQANTGRFFLVEINPRYWASITNALVSGVNFPALHVESLLLGRAPAHTVEVDRVVESRFVMGEIKVAQELISAGRWRELTGLFARHSREALMFEDFGLGGARAFLTEVRHALASSRTLGNFGFQTHAKTEFFLDAYARHAAADGARACEAQA
jgi:predicted ATP-grasp superfamily ATP-dependent carboligase